MTFQQLLLIHPSLKEVYSKMELQTSIGRKMLLDTEFSTSRAWIEQQWKQTEQAEAFIDSLDSQAFHHFLCIMSNICDIGGSLSLIEQGQTVDDVALFEIKTFCINAKQAGKLFVSDLMPVPDLQAAIRLLDPEGLESPRFYIYSAYSEELANKRRQWENAKQSGDEKAVHDLYLQTLELEDAIRERICKELYVHIPALKQAIRNISQMDIAVSKAMLNRQLGLNKAEITEKPSLVYNGMFHPVLKHIMLSKGMRYQDIDCNIDSEVFLITGANMTGKTVILKTLAINQLLLQFGFFVGCRSGHVCLVENVLCSIGDGQDEHEGLSSFASEIMRLNEILSQTKQDKRYLVLVDELARTTNPIEGKKLVEGFIRVCSMQKSLAVVTTHYSMLQAPCRHMRVRGFRHENLNPPIDIRQISDHIDYSLVEDDSSQVPTEAINLCRLLGVDKQWIEMSEMQD